jgi:hypothetical protein
MHISECGESFAQRVNALLHPYSVVGVTAGFHKSRRKTKPYFANALPQIAVNWRSFQLKRELYEKLHGLMGLLGSICIGIAL